MFGAAALTVLSPILLVAMAAWFLGDGRPTLYRRRVLGLKGVEFDALKLRTMRRDADAWIESQPELYARYQNEHKLDRDPRLTRWGRILRCLSIDEIPQLINVLRGKMSLVGPRMIHPSELQRFGDCAGERLGVNPGLTGLWQVSGRNDLTYESRVALDLEYIRHRSWAWDIQILARTVPAVLTARGAR